MSVFHPPEPFAGNMPNDGSGATNEPAIAGGVRGTAGARWVGGER